MISETDAQNEPREYLGRDIELDINGDIKFGSQNDFSKVIYYDNLKQALKTRLLTNLKELRLHKNYGSELQDMVSKSKKNDTEKEIKKVIKVALLQEPRIERVQGITVTYKNNAYNVSLTVKPILQKNTINLVYNLFQ